MTAKTWWDVKPPKKDKTVYMLNEVSLMPDGSLEASFWQFTPTAYDKHQMRKWLSQVPHGGIVDNKAVLIVYNEKAPEQSYLIVEDINL